MDEETNEEYTEKEIIKSERKADRLRKIVEKEKELLDKYNNKKELTKDNVSSNETGTFSRAWNIAKYEQNERKLKNQRNKLIVMAGGMTALYQIEDETGKEIKITDIDSYDTEKVIELLETMISNMQEEIKVIKEGSRKI